MRQRTVLRIHRRSTNTGKRRRRHRRVLRLGIGCWLLVCVRWVSADELLHLIEWWWSLALRLRLLLLASTFSTLTTLLPRLALAIVVGRKEVGIICAVGLKLLLTWRLRRLARLSGLREESLRRLLPFLLWKVRRAPLSGNRLPIDHHWHWRLSRLTNALSHSHGLHMLLLLLSRLHALPLLLHQVALQGVREETQRVSTGTIVRATPSIYLMSHLLLRGHCALLRTLHSGLLWLLLLQTRMLNHGTCSV